jgi:hypothetical protein
MQIEVSRQKKVTKHENEKYSLEQCNHEKQNMASLTQDYESKQDQQNNHDNHNKTNKK